MGSKCCGIAGQGPTEGEKEMVSLGGGAEEGVSVALFLLFDRIFKVLTSCFLKR